MTQQPQVEPGGSYDDLPDGPVRTVLNVPLQPLDASRPPAGAARHRAGRPRASTDGTGNHLWNTIRVGTLSALVVLFVTGLAMAGLVWQP